MPNGHNVIEPKIPRLKAVEVHCDDCRGDNVVTDAVIMTPSNKMYQNTIHKIQSREYTCPKCDHSVFVTLEFE